MTNTLVFIAEQIGMITVWFVVGRRVGRREANPLAYRAGYRAAMLSRGFHVIEQTEEPNVDYFEPMHTHGPTSDLPEDSVVML